jgi:hypothetical protein
VVVVALAVLQNIGLNGGTARLRIDQVAEPRGHEPISLEGDHPSSLNGDLRLVFQYDQ